MARRNMDSTDVAYNALWAAGGLADDIEALSYFTTNQKAQLADDKTTVQAASVATAAQLSRLLGALRKIVLMQGRTT